MNQNKGSQVLTLHVLQGPDRGKTFQLPDNEPQLIGRSSEALPITDRSVSRRHAELTPDGRSWYLRDIESANGTFLNGELLDERTKLKPGDQIRCGASLFVFGVTADKAYEPSPIRVVGPDQMEATVESAMQRKNSIDQLAAFQSGSSDGSHSQTAKAEPAQHLRVIYEITSIIGQTVDRKELLSRVMDIIFEEVGPDRGFILLQSGPNERPNPIVIRYKNRPKTPDEGHIPVSRTIVQHVLKNAEGILSSNAMDDTRFASGDSVMRYGIRSAICVPILSNERIFGVIHVDTSMANDSFSNDQLRLLTAIGMQAGLAMATSELIGSRVETERLAAIGETVASLSHSIKNILQGLRGGADAVELALNRDNLSLAREGWPIVGRNLDRIYALTMNMLAFSKQRQPEIELENLHSLVQEAVELVQPQCERKRVALEQNLDAAMPPVPLDASAIHQVLMNLLVNALEAVEKKTGRIVIHSRFDAARSVAEIAISDNGQGVPPEQREQIFEPFHSSKGQRGTGLGLAVARKIMHEHGGSLRLLNANSEGREDGATFILSIPTQSRVVDSSETKSPME